MTESSSFPGRFESLKGASTGAAGRHARGRRRIRVLFINDTARNGGPGRSLHSILRYLDPAAVHRAVVLPREGPIASLLSADGVAEEIHFVPDLVENPVEPFGRAMERRDLFAPLPLKAARLAGNLYKVARALRTLGALVKRRGIDLVYCNGTNADFAGAALAWGTGIPVLWHVRYTSVPALVAGVHRRASASPGVCRIVCVSRAAAALFPHCADKVAVIHNALDVGAFHPGCATGRLRAELGIDRDAVVFGMHGRVLRRKGLVELTHAARLAIDRAEGGSAPVRLEFLVVGDTPQDFGADHLEECRALASSLGVADRFHRVGFRTDVRPLVADFDVAVLPSVYADPLPRAVMESMALGKPVIAFDVGGVSEMVDHGVTGELVRFEPRGPGASPRAVRALADAIVRYAGDPQLRLAQGKAGRARIEQRFDARVHARRIEDEIRRAAGFPCEGPG